MQRGMMTFFWAYFWWGDVSEKRKANNLVHGMELGL